VIPGRAADAVARALAAGIPAVVEKRGEKGGMVHLADGTRVEAKPFKVDVVNVLGAGDAFASGVLYGLSKGWDWARTLRFGNATGAIVVTRQACANDMATEREALDMVASQGGF
jgi:5-dehydro-2-deoxygluconokinase